MRNIAIAVLTFVFGAAPVAAEPGKDARVLTVAAYYGRSDAQRVLKDLQARIDSKEITGGVRLVVVYKAYRTPRSGSLAQMQLAKDEGWDTGVYTGILDKVWTSAAGDLCLRMYVIEREPENGQPALRTFNTDKGEVQQLVVILPPQRPSA